MTDKKKNNDPYSQAVASGKYVRETRLQGKYDNVRVYWEDEVTRFFMRPYIEALLERRLKQNKGIRILDLGCGSGDGYELLMKMNQSNPGLRKNQVYLIPENNLEQYKGIEINQDLLNQNVQRWGKNPGMEFQWGDFSTGLPVKKEEPPYDIYLTSYGAMSHLNEDQTVKLFSDIVNHAEDGAVLVGDWLGRYSYEWQQLWDNDTHSEQWMDYYISYIYPPHQRDKSRLTPLKLRLLCREEILKMIERVEKTTGVNLETKYIGDRSIFVGRHMDTQDYNPHLKPLRKAVNSLLERNVRTDPDRLLIDYVPHPGIRFPDPFFQQFQSCWNFLIRYTMALCQEQEGRRPGADAPRVLLKMLDHMKQVIQGIGHFNMEDARANVVEPQLAYALRELEMSLQQGAGNGHGTVGIFVVNK
ncbi:MAG: class I SAM-dependent methyltransferase [Candidatus Aminicenantes bacterium]|nr:MAG: class I SAM-dependent methyltransferase [Candidatus Aminicenantes bacterium]